MFLKVFHEKPAQTDFSKEILVWNAKGLKHLNTVLMAERQAERKAERQEERQTKSQADMQICKSGRQAGRQEVKKADKHACMHAFRQAGCASTSVTGCDNSCLQMTPVRCWLASDCHWLPPAASHCFPGNLSFPRIGSSSHQLASTVALWHSGTLARWHYGTMALWH